MTSPTDGDHELVALISALPCSPGGIHLCMACTASATCRLGIDTQSSDPDGSVRYTASCPADYEGGRGVAHGGWTASVLDEMLGHVPLAHGSVAVTKSLTIEFLRPIPINFAMVGTARSVAHRGREWHVEGQLTAASTGTSLARAHGVWIDVEPVRHFDRVDAWVADQGSPGE